MKALENDDSCIHGLPHPAIHYQPLTINVYRMPAINQITQQSLGKEVGFISTESNQPPGKDQTIQTIYIRIALKRSRGMGKHGIRMQCLAQPRFDSSDGLPVLSDCQQFCGSDPPCGWFDNVRHQ